jgi:hypothetical protein
LFISKEKNMKKHVAMVGRSLGLDRRVQQLGGKHFIGGLHFATDDSHNEQDSVTFLVPLYS